MRQALSTGATGMIGQQLAVDVIAHNLSNVNTNAYKKNIPQFEDLLYTNIRKPGTPISVDSFSPQGLQVGHGVRPVAIKKVFSQGPTVETGNPLDTAVNGDGFFQIQAPDGTVMYTRDGSFNINGNGEIVTSGGYLLDPGFVIPQEATDLQIARDGTVAVLVTGDVEPQILGQINLARFINPAGLESIGENLYQETIASGEPIIGVPGEEEFGEVRQGMLESSNVEVVEEMVALITAQRAYEVNSKSIQTSDDMMSVANNLKR